MWEIRAWNGIKTIIFHFHSFPSLIFRTIISILVFLEGLGSASRIHKKWGCRRHHLPRHINNFNNLLHFTNKITSILLYIYHRNFFHICYLWKLFISLLILSKGEKRFSLEQYFWDKYNFSLFQRNIYNILVNVIIGTGKSFFFFVSNQKNIENLKQKLILFILKWHLTKIFEVRLR